MPQRREEGIHAQRISPMSAESGRSLGEGLPPVEGSRLAGARGSTRPYSVGMVRQRCGSKRLSIGSERLEASPPGVNALPGPRRLGPTLVMAALGLSPASAMAGECDTRPAGSIHL